MIDAQAAIEADERRLRRDQYREAGGSKRRPLKSFYTATEKRELRDQHNGVLKTAIAELRDPAGFAAWCETLDLNPQLTACNAALVALQTPGEIVGTSRTWAKQGAKVSKGDQAAGRITAPGFWPLAYFTADQVGAELAEIEAPELPPESVLSRLRERLEAGLAEGGKARLVLDAVAEEYRSGRGNLWGTA